MMTRRLERALIATLKAQLAGGKAMPPEAGRPLWAVFIRLCHTRAYNGHGPNPIQLTEIESYCRLLRVPLEPHHVAIIMALDRVWMEKALERPPEGVGTLPHVSKHPISATLFDLAID